MNIMNQTKSKGTFTLLDKEGEDPRYRGTVLEPLLAKDGWKRTNLSCFFAATQPCVPLYDSKMTGHPDRDVIEELRKSNGLTSLNELSAIGNIQSHMLPNVETNSISSGNFLLADLWRWYDRPFGFEIDVIVDNIPLEFYYVPHLSAIQLKVNSSHMGETSHSTGDINGIRFGAVNPSDPLVSEPSVSRVASNFSSRNILSARDAPGDPLPIRSTSLKDNSGNDDDGITTVYEYFETATPGVRVPFVDKVMELAETEKAYASLSILDLDPSSWYSIAWYPIRCHNHTMRHTRGLILTYHRLTPNNLIIQPHNSTDNSTGTDKQPLRSEQPGTLSQHVRALNDGGISLYSNSLGLDLDGDAKDMVTTYVAAALLFGFLPYKMSPMWYSRLDSNRSGPTAANPTHQPIFTISRPFVDSNVEEIRSDFVPLFLIHAVADFLKEGGIVQGDFDHCADMLKQLFR